MDNVTVNDFINNNDNCLIQIDITPTLEDVGLLNETIYKGMLYDTPNELREKQVVKEGFLLGAQHNILYVLKN